MSGEGSEDDRKMPAKSQTDREELDLLASLGSTVANMADYESNILREAELSAAPRISGIGLPELHTLGPSAIPASDVPYAQTLLSQIRSQLANNGNDNGGDEKLFLKEQLLLVFLQTVAKDGNYFVHPQEEARQEERRKRRVSVAKKAPSSEDYAPSQDGMSMLGWQPSVKNTIKKRARPNPNPNAAKDKDKEKDCNPSERLEMIKQKKVKVSFSSEPSSYKATPPKKARVSIMKRKQGSNNPSVPDDDIVQRKERLKEMRNEREKRRRKRRQRWMPSDEDGSSSNSEGGEREFQDDLVHETPVKSQTEVATEDTEEKKGDDDDNNADNRGNDDQSDMLQEKIQPLTIKQEEPEPQAFATCPLCKEQLETPDNSTQSEVDAILSLHMQTTCCQTSSTPGQRRSTRARAVTNYSEVDGEEDHHLGGRTAKGTPVAAPSNILVGTATVETETDKDSFELGDDDADKDEELDVDNTGTDPLSELLEPRTKPRRSATKRAAPPPTRAPSALDDMDDDDYEDRVDEWVDTGVQSMRDMKERDQTEVPPGEEVYEGGLVIPAWINDRLFPYQRTALEWMWELHRQEAGGIIGDEMGLGKTVQISAFLGSMAASRKLKSILVICPATILQHWLKELAKWAPGLRRVLIHQSGEVDGRPRTITPHFLKRMSDWLKKARRSRLFEAIDEEDLESRDPSSFVGTGLCFVTTYENVRRSPDIWTNHKWDYVIMDEAQKIRNPDAAVTLSCKRLRTPHRLALSGTPIQNDLKELWSLFDFVFPGRLGTLPAFENEFAIPIKRGGYSNASPLQVQLAYRCALILRDLINPYLLRRQKKDVKEVSRMPGKTEQVLFCRLSDRQRGLYESFLHSDIVKGIMRGSPQLLGAITMLRKICNHPDLVCPPDAASFDSFARNGFSKDLELDDVSDDGSSMGEEDSLTERSGKLEVLAKILPLWKEQGHRVLIFCQWKKMLNIIQRFTELQGWKFGRLDGSTNVASRQRLVDTFNNDESYFGMLMTTRTGGVGLNLTGADRIILYDPDWNPQTDAQARERAWRFGQEREVTIYRLIAAGTVEEKIYQRQIFKTALSNRILQDPVQKRLFSQRDLKDLFTLKADGGSVISGGEGLTETGELTKGAGYVDPDEEAARENSTDDGETMKTVLKSQGLAGVFDHRVIETNAPSKKSSVREMEEKAKRIAREALIALEESVADKATFSPTWTGSAETSAENDTRRFGESRVPNGGFRGAGGVFGGTGIAGVNRLTAGSGNSSSALLASLRQRNEDIKTGGAPDLSGTKTKEYSQLLGRIRTFVRRKIPTTDAILDEFSNIPKYDAAVFRRLLKSVARVEGGRWRLKR